MRRPHKTEADKLRSSIQLNEYVNTRLSFSARESHTPAKRFNALIATPGNDLEGSSAFQNLGGDRTKKLFRTLLIGLAVGLSGPVVAMDVGRAHLVSAPGQPLVVTIPLRGLSAQDLQSLSARVASEQQWVQAGLTPPVPLAGLSVRILDGVQSGSRVIEVRAGKAPSSSVIDLLIDLSSATTSRLVQSSVITRSAPRVTLAGQTHDVMRGHTLFEIARQFPVQGATIYQMLWALYQANPHAFISQNMNLLRAGVSLSIPSAATVLATDPAVARAQYLAHVRAFQASRGRPGASVIPAQANVATRAAQPAQIGGVEATPEVVAPANASDKVRLSSVDRNGNPANPSNVSVPSGSAFADQQTSQKLALQEEQSRRQELERNVQALKSALAATGAANALNPQGVQNTAQAQAGADAVSTAGGSAVGGVGAGGVGVGGAGTGAANATAGVAGSTGGTAASGLSSAGAAAAGSAGSAVGGSGSGGVTAGGATAGGASGAGAGASGAAVDSQGLGAQSTGSQVASTQNADQSNANQNAGGQGNGVAGASAQGSGGAAGSAAQSAATDTASSDSPVEQVKQWVSDNTLAAGALILAMIALFFAWIMRSSAVREASSREVVSPQAQAFERKLKDISLDLDDASDDVAAAPTDKTAAASPVGTPGAAGDQSRKSEASSGGKSSAGKSNGGKSNSGKSNSGRSGRSPGGKA